MRHRKAARKLNRNSSHRTAMYRNMSASLINHEVIKTTLPKAKELRRVAEPLITLAKQDSISNRRLAFARLRDKAAVFKLFEELGPRFQHRAGGYLRILKCGYRVGDSAPLAWVQLLDNEKLNDSPVSTDTTPAKESEPSKKQTAAVADQVDQQSQQAVAESAQDDALTTENESVQPTTEAKTDDTNKPSDSTIDEQVEKK